ncbi:hypothetical protein [Streptomyces sp. NPDC058295]
MQRAADAALYDGKLTLRGERGVVHLVRAAQGRGPGVGGAGEDMQSYD